VHHIALLTFQAVLSWKTSFVEENGSVNLRVVAKQQRE
jgi:hypothetical protein